MEHFKFIDSYNSIKLFCEWSKEGFIVVETNNCLFKDKFIEKISSDFDICIERLENLKEKNTFYNKDIIIVDEFETKDSTEAVVNINYNRNWFVSLHKNIIFVLRSSTVDELIQYSASFWSCVAIHKVFSFRYKGIMFPHFIRSSADIELDGFARLKLYPGEPAQITSKYKKTLFILNKYFGNFIFHDNMYIFLMEQLKLNKSKHKNDDFVESFCSKILRLIEEFRSFNLYDTALECICFLQDNFIIGSRYINIEIEMYRLKAEINYSLGNLDESLGAYAQIFFALREKEIYFYQEKDKTAILFNNIGVVLYAKGDYEDALFCFDSACEIIDSDEYSKLNFLLTNFLYNLSLVSYQLGDDCGALKNIEQSIQIYSQYNYFSRSDMIVRSILNVLKSYIMINSGDIGKVENLLISSLKWLREELDEKCLSIMEAHFVYAKLFFYQNKLDQAKSCIEKSYQITKEINCPLWVRNYIRELFGEICFFKKEYKQALYFFNMVYSQAKKNNFYTDEILDWVLYLKGKCEENINQFG